jgi:ribose 5-phosphate isomerase B
VPPTEAEVRELVRRVLERVLAEEPWARPNVPDGQPRPALRGRALVDEASLRDLPPGSTYRPVKGALITPLARQLAQERNITIDEGQRSAAQISTGRTPPQQRVAIGADHGGLAMKEALKPHLQSLGYDVVDCGTVSSDPVDYPDIAYAVAALVADGKCANGIIIDGAGIGSCMAANKVPGVRAALCYDHATASNSREHNHANVMTLGAGLIGVNLAKQITQTWLATPYGAGRHAKRVEKITAIEKRFAK